MKMFKQYRDKRLAKKEAKLLEQAQVEAELTEKGLKELQILTDKMISKPCPINKGNCDRSCVHFQEGSTWVTMWNDTNYMQVIRPVCKLWGG